MTKSDSKRLSICRLLTLLFVLVAGTSCIQVNGAFLPQGVNWNNIIRNHSEDDIVPGTTQVRKHFLLNHCSNRLVQIKNSRRTGVKSGVDTREKKRENYRVNAKGRYPAEMSFSTVIFLPTPRGTIVMRGVDSHNYICISSRSGRPTTRAKPISRDCEFREEYADDGSMQYRLANNTDHIYLGFKKDGKPLKGTKFKNRRTQKCFLFTKLPTSERSVNCRNTDSNGPKGINYCDIYKKMIAKSSKDKRKQKKTKARKVRHERNHKKSRRHAR